MKSEQQMSTSSEEESNNQNSKQNKISKQNQNFIKFQPKIILLGDSTVGKTSILERYTNNNFNLHNTLTIGVDLRVTQHMVGDNKNMKLKIWDTSGQERFRAIAENFYKGAHVNQFLGELNL
ncbi:P-loop containing nucleoside triphosphate hydrolase [Pseudocohnilembus persalinus]|uniref:p-loop containing nucleoside triphosphate hydrolase n=1 Tax=Pseudocohnilembus persalinus TaxID=266149 RepID=A0A0V0QGA4_PSEPJ|nr:P-loop containing nucleoside triphosphate hydrolase [Pseudocohnilembus persalinus]|eukprot:KRX01281.1 P-loop containing nucleoside triphosphate hydrolase [Pseudocohnilembus persalinus]